MFEEKEPVVKEYGERTLNAARLCYLLRQECEIEDPWHIVAVSLCAHERMHSKDSWEYILTHKTDIEDIERLFERANSPEEFREGLIELKERDLERQIARGNLK
ncbi:MAG: hypothetical protein H0U65_00910 [Rubrobacter sp.]|nr:hypothetical protein [Rubrobacter sp.]